jgi:GalNAc-alpha-(1->4)-GalNAc-alpha-(1->3)-diNAcBac-PP-undecaprenol alpha-1,4-N-acetyl-D-galactosaminyltransferase
MIIALAREMSERGHQVAILSWDGVDAVPFYEIPQAIAWLKLEASEVGGVAKIGERLRRARRARQLVGGFRPDVLVAFQSGTFKALWTYCLGMGVPMVAAERNSPTMYDFRRAGDRGRRAAFAAFRLAKRLVVQCESYRELHPADLRQSLAVIPNPIYQADRFARPSAPGANGRNTLLAVGRLSFQKNFECLLMAFAGLADKHPTWDLVIAGEGEERAALEQLVQALGLGARVLMEGPAADVSTLYVNAQLTCLPSRWEGFPNALAEAMAHGLPAVGFEDCAGVRDLIEDGRTGALAKGNGDAKTLAMILDWMMADGDARARMGEAGRLATLRYEPSKVMDSWETLLHAECSGQ